jgi:hypothetical protein
MEEYLRFRQENPDFGNSSDEDEDEDDDDYEDD